MSLLHSATSGVGNVPGVRYVDLPVDYPKGHHEATVRRIIGEPDQRVRALPAKLAPDLQLPPSVLTCA